MKSKNKPKKQIKKPKATSIKPSVQDKPKPNTVTGYYNPWLEKYFNMEEHNE